LEYLGGNQVAIFSQECVNARLIRFEFGAIADIPNTVSEFPTPHYLAFVFVKGGKEIKEIFPSTNVGQALDLTYIGQVLEKKEVDTCDKVTYYFAGGGRIFFG
jgi:hypothetical protein